MARKSSTPWLGAPSGRRAWMWIITPPSSAIRRASAAYSCGVYGIAGHCSRLASAPEIAQVMMTGSSRDKGLHAWGVVSATPHSFTSRALLVGLPARGDDVPARAEGERALA